MVVKGLRLPAALRKNGTSVGKEQTNLGYSVMTEIDFEPMARGMHPQFPSPLPNSHSYLLLMHWL